VNVGLRWIEFNHDLLNHALSTEKCGNAGLTTKFWRKKGKEVSLATIYTIIRQTWGCNPEIPQKWLMDQTGPNDGQT
jgi:hypothetical protein